MNCQKMESSLADLLLDPESVSAEAGAHVEQCAHCKEELASLQATMQAMDAWTAPEPTPYFDGKLAARLRAEKEAEPAGFFERLRTRLLFGSNLHMRPILAAGMTLALIIGGGSYAGYVSLHQPPPIQASATIRDLQSLDGNEEVFQQLSSLDQPDLDNSSGPNDDSDTNMN